MTVWFLQVDVPDTEEPADMRVPRRVWKGVAEGDEVEVVEIDGAWAHPASGWIVALPLSVVGLVFIAFAVAGVMARV